MQLIECVPNISDGQNPGLLVQVTQAIRGMPGILLVEYEMGYSVNRSVITIVGKPKAVEAAAFKVAKYAIAGIDMRKQHGTHPRIGALDVCPFIPLHNTTMQQCIEISHRFGKKLAKAYEIPVFLYAASTPQKRRLADLRRGGYEKLVSQDNLHPDFGPEKAPPRSGAVITGAREVMLAYNLNLATREVKKAAIIAARLRESGGFVIDKHGKKTHKPGRFKGVQALGWYVNEFQIAQVSTNILKTKVVSLANLFKEAKRLAESLNTTITGSEIVGLVPREMLIAAGRDFLKSRPTDPCDQEAIRVAIRELNPNDVTPFHIDKKILDINRLLAKATEV